VTDVGKSGICAHQACMDSAKLYSSASKSEGPTLGAVSATVGVKARLFSLS
jgi:hypothetical protein